MNLGELLIWSARLAGCAEVPADSQVYLEAAGDVRRVLFGVDIDAADLLFARDAGYDAVIAHHPMGEHARMDFARVVDRQVDQMVAEGVPQAAAREAVGKRLGPLHRRDHMGNYNRLVDAGRLIGVPFCNIHLACDILGRQAIIELLARRAAPGARVADCLAWLGELPEMEAALTDPEVWLGDAGQPLGRWTVAMAGGTNGGFPVFREYFRAGVDTILAMHVAESDLGLLREEAPAGRSLVVTGHMATDSIGINQVIAEMEEHGIEVVRTSGVIGRS